MKKCNKHNVLSMGDLKLNVHAGNRTRGTGSAVLCPVHSAIAAHHFFEETRLTPHQKALATARFDS